MCTIKSKFYSSVAIDFEERGECIILLNQFELSVLTDATLTFDSSRETTYCEILDKKYIAKECFRYTYPYRIVTA